GRRQTTDWSTKHTSAALGGRRRTTDWSTKHTSAALGSREVAASTPHSDRSLPARYLRLPHDDGISAPTNVLRAMAQLALRLEKARGAHTAADAHGDDPVALFSAPQLSKQVACEP